MSIGKPNPLRSQLVQIRGNRQSVAIAPGGGSHIVGRDQQDVQPGRGQAAVARFKLIDLYLEDARDISHEDAIAEGFESIALFLEAWVHIYDSGDVRMWRQPGLFADTIEWIGKKGQTLDSDTHDLAQWLRDNRPAALYAAWVLKLELLEVYSGL